MKKFIYATVLLITITSCSVFAQVTWDDFDSPGIINYSYFDGVGFNQEFTNPSTGGINSSAVCASYDRNSGTEYDVIVIQPSGTAIIDTITDYVSGTKKMSLKVFSPEAGKKVQITLEDNTVAGPTNYPSGRHSEYTATTTTSNEWETLTFTLVNQPDASVSDGAINQMVVLFDPGTFNSDNYLFDDLMGPELYNPCEGVVAEPSIIDDFECQRNLNYSFANGTFTVESNPVKTGVNTSETCGKFRKFTPPLNDGAFGGDLATFFNTSQFKYAHKIGRAHV